MNLAVKRISGFISYGASQLWFKNTRINDPVRFEIGKPMASCKDAGSKPKATPWVVEFHLLAKPCKGGTINPDADFPSPLQGLRVRNVSSNPRRCLGLCSVAPAGRVIHSFSNNFGIYRLPRVFRLSAPLRLCAFALTSSLLLFTTPARAGEEEGEIQLKKFAATYSTLDEWKARAASIRQGILRGANLDPLPTRCPLNPIVRDLRKHDGYTVENVAFESLPGFYVTGNLYRPVGRQGKVPAILNPHGHFRDPVYSARTRPDMQTRCAQFARMGAIAFAYDMVGYGESSQTTHDDPNVLTLQLWNSMRVLDFLLTLPEVDPARIGVTGASGGGTQSFLITATDDRITVSAPVVMVSSHFFGGCKCESGMPIHRDPETNNADIAACAAPRPQLIVSIGSDWTHNVPGIEFPYIWKVYRLFGKEKDVENFHLPHEEHDYGFPKRAPVYEFFARHLGLQRIGVDPLNGKTPPEGIKIEEHSKMLVFGGDHPRPATALANSKAIADALNATRSTPSK